MEIWITLAIISMELWVFRWVILRMPVFGEAHEVVEEKTAEDMEVVTWKASVL
jgi:hypothetical protein